MLRELRPYLSLFIIFFSLFFILVTKMEVRRRGYIVLKKGRIYKELKDQKRLYEMETAQYLSLSSLSRKATQRLDMKQADGSQIIQMNGISY